MKKHTDRLDVRVPPDIKAIATKIAAKMGKSLSEIIRDYLREFIKQQKVK